MENLEPLRPSVGSRSGVGSIVVLGPVRSPCMGFLPALFLVARSVFGQGVKPVFRIVASFLFERSKDYFVVSVQDQDVGALGKRSLWGFRARRTGRLHSRAGGMKENYTAQRQARQRTPPCPAGRGSAPAAPRGSTDGRDDGERNVGQGEKRGGWMMA